MPVDDRRPLGAVLTGGASRRMGTDKALVEVGGAPLAVRAARVLRAGGCEPVVAIGGPPRQLAAYGLEVVPDRFPGAGPLDGIIRALELAGGAPAVVVACDMPWLTPGVVSRLVAALGDTADPLDAVVAEGERREPLCAVWAPTARQALTSAFAEGERAVHRTLARLRVGMLTVDQRVVGNVNTPTDLAEVLAEVEASGDPASG